MTSNRSLLGPSINRDRGGYSGCNQERLQMYLGNYSESQFSAKVKSQASHANMRTERAWFSRGLREPGKICGQQHFKVSERWSDGDVQVLRPRRSVKANSYPSTSEREGGLQSTSTSLITQEACGRAHSHVPGWARDTCIELLGSPPSQCSRCSEN